MSIAPPPQEIGDPDARQHGVEARGKGLGFRRCRFLDRRDLQHALVEHDIGQQAALCLDVGFCLGAAALWRAVPQCNRKCIQWEARAIIAHSNYGLLILRATNASVP